MTCVLDMHYCLKTNFSSNKPSKRQFFGQKVWFQTIVHGKNTYHLKSTSHVHWYGVSLLLIKKIFKKILRHFLQYKNCSNLEDSMLSTIWSCYAEKTQNIKLFWSGYYIRWSKVHSCIKKLEVCMSQGNLNQIQKQASKPDWLFLQFLNDFLKLQNLVLSVFWNLFHFSFYPSCICKANKVIFWYLYQKLGNFYSKQNDDFRW